MKVLKKISNILIILGLCVVMGETSYAWDCKPDGTGTHALIAEQGLKMLNNDLSSDESNTVRNNINILNQYLNELKVGSTFPDYDPNGYDLYQDHFFDPDTGNNFSIDNKWYESYPIYDTAETQIRKFAALAKNEWQKGNFKEATFLLGEGLHYVGDLNTPYHAANVTAIDSPGHVKFETFVEKRKENYAIDTIGNNTTTGLYKEAIINPSFDKWMTQNSIKYAKMAKNLYYSHSTMKHSWEDWDYAGKEAVKNSQLYTAEILYRFINEVSNDNVGLNDTETNEFNLVIKTGDNKYSGTDDYVYFGFETNNGEKFEWKLDNAGNDFERNQVDTYILKIKDGKKVDINNINKYWIKKENLTYAGDDWELTNVKLIVNSNVVKDQDVNKVLNGNEIYYLN